MGKKSVVDGSFMESAFEDVNVPPEVRAGSPVHRVKDLQALLIQMLKTAPQTQQKRALDMLVYYNYYYHMLLLLIYHCCTTDHIFLFM